MKPLSERDENFHIALLFLNISVTVGMKPLSERDENSLVLPLVLIAVP